MLCIQITNMLTRYVNAEMSMQRMKLLSSWIPAYSILQKCSNGVLRALTTRWNLESNSSSRWTCRSRRRRDAYFNGRATINWPKCEMYTCDLRSLPAPRIHFSARVRWYTFSHWISCIELARGPIVPVVLVPVPADVHARARHREFIGENENEASRVIVIAVVLSVLFAVCFHIMWFASSNSTQPTI